jgi:hydrogenase maturation protein HypF
MLECKSRGIPPAEIALAFHSALVELIVQLAQKADGENVLLTGGCMQNKLLAEAAIAGLRRAGFKPFWHSRIPPNDGGLAVGQIIGKLFQLKLNTQEV